MKIDRTFVERELSAVRAEVQKAANVLQQATGAEKVLLAMLAVIDQPEPAPEPKARPKKTKPAPEGETK